MTLKRPPEKKMSVRLVAVALPSMARRVEAYRKSVERGAGGEFTESSALRSLLQRALDSLGIQDPGPPKPD